MGPILWKCLACLPIVLAVTAVPSEPQTSYYRLQLKEGGRFLAADSCSDLVALRPRTQWNAGACQLWRLVPASARLE